MAAISVEVVKLAVTGGSPGPSIHVVQSIFLIMSLALVEVYES